MKVLIAIFSCQRYAKRRAALRETWLQDVPGEVDWRFFVGKVRGVGPGLETNLEVLECWDDYGHLCWKMKEMLEWARERGYDYVFKCDDDTFVVPQRLLSSGFDLHDFVGWQWPGRPFPYGGPGYWLSRRMIDAVLEHGLPLEGMEDVMVGKAAVEAGIPLFHDPRYVSGLTSDDVLPGPGNDLISYHHCDMPAAHSAFSHP